MKNQLLLCLITLFYLEGFSQISFEKGYIINNTNQKTECLIKNKDWQYNPSEIEYRLSEESDVIVGDISALKEFGIYNVSKFIRSTVDIDKSSEKSNKLSLSQEPEFKKETLFLKALIEGKASLYSYKASGLNRYFYSHNGSDISQLISKTYFNKDGLIAKNKTFKSQLWTDLKCKTIEQKTLQKLEYRQNDLIDFFTTYNQCSDSEYTTYQKKEKKSLFHITIRPGLNSSNLKLLNDGSSLSINDTEYGNKIGFRLGVEVEFVLPFYKNKWAIALEPTYQSYSSMFVDRNSIIFNSDLTSEVDYSSIEIPISVRHYMFLNENSSLFINAGVVFDVNLGTKITFKRDDGFSTRAFDNKSSGNNFAMGFGYKYKNKYSLELRYQSSRNLLNGFNTYRTKYQTLSVIVGYSIF